MRATFFLLWFLFSSTFALGCTCISSSGLTDRKYLKQLNSVGVILEGEVISVGERREESRNLARGVLITFAYRPVDLKVLKVWKGVTAPMITVEAEAWSSCAAPRLEAGSKLMLYLYRTNKKALQMSYCSIDGFDNDRTKRLLGPGTPIVQRPAPA